MDVFSYVLPSLVRKRYPEPPADLTFKRKIESDGLEATVSTGRSTHNFSCMRPWRGGGGARGLPPNTQPGHTEGRVRATETKAKGRGPGRTGIASALEPRVAPSTTQAPARPEVTAGWSARETPSFSPGEGSAACAPTLGGPAPLARPRDVLPACVRFPAARPALAGGGHTQGHRGRSRGWWPRGEPGRGLPGLGPPPVGSTQPVEKTATFAWTRRLALPGTEEWRGRGAP